MGGAILKGFLIKNILQIISVLFIITLIVFFLVNVSGDPVSLKLPLEATEEQRQELIHNLGLDKPLHVQYGIFLKDLVTGDFGKSINYSLPALPIVLERLPATIELAIAAMIIAILISVPLGVLSATKRNSIFDVFITGVSVLGKAMPSFWIGIMLVLFFSITFQIFPVSGRGTLAHLILPAFTLGIGIAAQMTRLIRSSIIDILSQDYIRTARSKGLIEFIVVFKHAFRNALIPVVTITALQTSTLIGGAIVTEAVFGWPGLGQLLVDAVNSRDMAIVQAATFIIALFIIVSNLLADFAYRKLDPRIN